MTSADGDQEHPRSVVALLRDPIFAPFFWGKLASTCGVWAQNLSAAVLMYTLTESAFMVGMVSALQFSPVIVMSFWSGVLSDRFDRRKVLVVGRLTSGLAVTVLALLLLIRGTEGFGGPSVLLMAVFVAGAGWALSQPPMLALLPLLVPSHDLEPALALNAAAPSLGRTIGPALGAGLLFLGSPGLAFLLAGLAHVSFAVTLMVLVRPRKQVKPKIRPNIWGGLKYLLGDRKAGSLMIGVSLLSLGGDPVLTLSPPLADALGIDEAGAGLFVSSFGVGAVSLTLLFQRLREHASLRWAGVLGFWLLAGGLVSVAFSTQVWVACLGFVIQGAGFMMANVSLNTRIQRRVPDELRGRVMAMWGIAWMGSRPVAALINGWLGDLVGVRPAMGVTALAVLSASLFAKVTYR